MGNIFENAHRIQPKQIKWRLMIASCHRRMRNYQTAIDIYVDILDNDEDECSMDIRIRCLQYLCTIMKQIGDVNLDKYQIELDKQLDIQARQQQQNDNNHVMMMKWGLQQQHTQQEFHHQAQEHQHDQVEE